MIRKHAVALVLGAALVLAGASGYLTSQALGGAGAATRTVTINIPTGEQGPPGPPGPTGPPGAQGPRGEPGLACPAGFTEANVVFNTPGGQRVIFTCLQN